MKKVIKSFQSAKYFYSLSKTINYHGPISNHLGNKLQLKRSGSDCFFPKIACMIEMDKNIFLHLNRFGSKPIVIFVVAVEVVGKSHLSV